MVHCDDNEADRKKGDDHERIFIKKLLAGGCSVTGAHLKFCEELGLKCAPLSDNSHGDVSFMGAGHVLAEVKGKYPDSQETYGLEEYRVRGLRHVQRRYDNVVYIICNTKTSTWMAADFVILEEKIKDGTAFLQDDYTYYNGVKSDQPVPTYHWPADLWSVDVKFWTNANRWEARRAIAAGKQFEFISGTTPTSWRVDG